MPLSKVRDRERKRQERAKIKLDRQFLSSQTSKVVQPKVVNQPLIDADGNIIPEYF